MRQAVRFLPGYLDQPQRSHMLSAGSSASCRFWDGANLCFGVGSAAWNKHVAHKKDQKVLEMDLLMGKVSRRLSLKCLSRSPIIAERRV